MKKEQEQEEEANGEGVKLVNLIDPPTQIE